jgi:hypothetical protein
VRYWHAALPEALDVKFDEAASDGQRFLFLLPGPVTPETSTGLIVVQNWTEELRQRIAH